MTINVLSVRPTVPVRVTYEEAGETKTVLAVVDYGRDSVFFPDGDLGEDVARQVLAKLDPALNVKVPAIPQAVLDEVRKIQDRTYHQCTKPKV